MKIIIKKSSLEACVKNLSKVINRKNALPILGDILFDVNDQEKTVRLTASDSEIWLNYQLPLDEVDGGGRFCVAANILLAMLECASDQPLTIFANHEGNQQLELTHDSGTAHCPIENADEYPTPFTIPVPEDTIVGFDGQILTTAVKRSLFACATDDLRPVMNGVYLNFFDGQLDVVASDGHVIISSEIPTNENHSLPVGILLPRKVANILPDIIGGREISIWTHDLNCQIDVKNDWNTTLQFRCIEGNYPKYQALLMTTKTYTVTCDRLSLLSALKAVKPFAPDSSNMVSLTFNEESDIVVQGEDYDFGISSNIIIGMDGYEGHLMSIGMKATTLINILQRLTSYSVELVFDDPTHPVIIRPADKAEDDKETITCLQIPMLLNS